VKTRNQSTDKKRQVALSFFFISVSEPFNDRFKQRSEPFYDPLEKIQASEIAAGVFC
jgi:hypothetical protein